MEPSPRDPIRKVIASGLLLLMVTLAVAVPVLDTGSFPDHPVVESEHAPGECVTGHDHRICAQTGVDVDEGADESPLAAILVAVSPHGGFTGAVTTWRNRATRSRAPPLT